MSAASQAFWRGRRVLVTGHTGFKGAWLTLWLADRGADVVGLALPPEGRFDLFARAGIASLCDSRFVDLRDAAAVRAIVDETRPAIVFHLAAQPLVRASYRAPVDTWATNVMGTVHLLDALRQAQSASAIVVVTSDKCYEHGATSHAFVETDTLGGHDPYSASKAAVEIAVASYRASFFDAASVGVATARAGNVIGGGDGALDRLIPDLVDGALRDETVVIRRPDAVRPWQHVVDPLAGYAMLAEALVRDPARFAGAWNFGPDPVHAAPVIDVVERFTLAFDRARPARLWQVHRDSTLHEAATLTLDSGKARTALGWRPSFDLDAAIAATAAGYRVLLDGGDVRAMMREQIATTHVAPIAEAHG